MLIHDLHRRKSYRAARASSFDRSGRNDDSLYVPPGDTIAFARLHGPGIIKHIWMTTHPEAMTRLVLRIFWDDAPHPSVQTPLASFFGMGFDQRVPLTCAAMVVSSGGGMNCYFPMPFKTGARFEIENQGVTGYNFYFHIDYTRGEPIDQDACYFHSLWHTEITTPTRGPAPEPVNYDAAGNFHDHLANTDGKDNYRILKTSGTGHYVGCFMHVFSFLPASNNYRCWYGEGDDMIFVDDETWPPAIHATGEEDYFNDAWGLHEFQSPYFGCHYLDAIQGAVGRYSTYRFHIPDPIPFQKNIDVTLEHGHGNERGDWRESLAFYYLTQPQPTVRLPRYEDRVLVNDFQIVPRRVHIPSRNGPYDLTFPDGQPRVNS